MNLLQQLEKKPRPHIFQENVYLLSKGEQAIANVEFEDKKDDFKLNINDVKTDIFRFLVTKQKKQPVDEKEKPFKIKVMRKKIKKVTRRLKLSELNPKEREEYIKRITKKPKEIKKIIRKEVLQKSPSIFKDNIPPKREKIIIKSSKYYMNNRKKFINFINSLYNPYKKELAIEKESVTCDRRDAPFSHLTHQKLVRDYMNIYSPYRGILLYHGLGSGKTCSSIAIAEGLKESKKIVVMTPASLRPNYIKEIKKCGDELYRKNSHWEFINIDKNPDLVNALSKSMSISKPFIKKHRGAFLINIKKRANYNTLSMEEKILLDQQIDEMILHKYQFISYNGMRMTHLKDYSVNFTRNPFDNKVIIIDEVHNFVSRIVNKLNKKESLSMKLYEYLMTAENCKIVFLTGTPMINYPNEIAILFNMLRGKIKTWNIKLNIKGRNNINQKFFKKIFKKIHVMDYIEYNSTLTMLTITRNPFGFYNKLGRGYQGVSLDKRGQITDTQFMKLVENILNKNKIEMISGGVSINEYKALPDDLDEFEKYFIDKMNYSMKNNDMLKKRIIGLTSYFRSAQEKLMPKYSDINNFHLIKIEMSDYQFIKYEAVRSLEIKQKKGQMLKAKKAGDDIYADNVSSYRIFSRLFCNFVFPSNSIKRPLPTDYTNEQSIESFVDDVQDLLKQNKEGDKSPSIEQNILNESIIDNEKPNSLLTNEKIQIDNNELNEMKNNKSKLLDKNANLFYAKKIKEALQKLQNRALDFLTPEALKTYSPKFLNILENIKDSDHPGLHLLYSQFRTLEGIGIFQLVLEANGYTQFKIKKDSTNNWVLDIDYKNMGKPMFALYTGTETNIEEKELIRSIYNSDWGNVPSKLKNQLEKISSNNHFGEIIKLLMITSSGAEGIDLKNVRYVHIMEPYWHPVRTEQVIGRARRICSHNKLPEKYQTVDVFMYIMKFSQSQMDTDQSINLKKNDKSKLDDNTVVTTDEALFEISTIKKKLNDAILKGVKESSIDCNLFNSDNSESKLKCLSFGNATSDSFVFNPEFGQDDSDNVNKYNKKEKKWIGKEVEINGTYYAINMETMDVYDLESYKEGRPILLGKLVKDGDKYEFRAIE